MSDKPIPPVPAGLTQEQVEAIAGGACSAAEIDGVINNLTKSYETLIEFTTYMMERVKK
jgi:hypothetical protein